MDRIVKQPFSGFVGSGAYLLSDVGAFWIMLSSIFGKRETVKSVVFYSKKWLFLEKVVFYCFGFQVNGHLLQTTEKFFVGIWVVLDFLALEVDPHAIEIIYRFAPLLIFGLYEVWPVNLIYFVHDLLFLFQTKSNLLFFFVFLLTCISELLH